jgi:hypothetical protein
MMEMASDVQYQFLEQPRLAIGAVLRSGRQSIIL